MTLEKAMIQRVDENGNNKGDPVRVLFNPAEYSIEQSNQFQTIALPGQSAPITQFISGNTRTLTMDLFFDSYEKGEDVRIYTDQVTGLLNMDGNAPPICKFMWGKWGFNAVVERVLQRFTMFLGSGIPVRATLNVVFKEYKTISEQIQYNPGNENKTKQITVKPGETLSLIAGREYGDAQKWKIIADANGIENPRKLRAGQQITIPPLE